MRDVTCLSLMNLNMVCWKPHGRWSPVFCCKAATHSTWILSILSRRWYAFECSVLEALLKIICGAVLYEGCPLYFASSISESTVISGVCIVNGIRFLALTDALLLKRIGSFFSDNDLRCSTVKKRFPLMHILIFYTFINPFECYNSAPCLYLTSLWQFPMNDASRGRTL